MFDHHDGARMPARLHVHAPALLLFASSLFTLYPVAADATTAAGRTTGSFAVSPTGAATYTIPIWAPPGPHGMQPNIALTYNSQQGNSYVGVGWGISGLSSIYRCNLTFAQDAAPAPVALVTGDGYCMDGQRLRLTGGTYGEAGSTYQTEVANFVNVTAYGTAGNGPSYWVAQDGNGRTYTYGDGGGSQVLAAGSTTASAWMLNEVSDPYGNTMTVSYTTATGSTVPSLISWTPSSHGSGSYNYTMTFAYGPNVPQSSLYAYTAGTAVTNTNLLESITIAYQGTTVKVYELTYETSPTTKRYELQQVQECASSGTSNCKLPTTFAYQSGTAGVSTSGTQVSSTNGGALYALYDFNGDGYPDLIYINDGYWYVAFGSASGYGTPISTGISAGIAIFPGNFLGTGTDGILADNGGTWYYYTWNGSSFTGATTHLAYDNLASYYLVADANGDGLPDLIEVILTPNVSLQITTRLNTSSGSSVSFGSAVAAYTLNDANLVAANVASATSGATTLGNLRRFDFNGDGRDDLILETKDQTTVGGNKVTTNTTSELLSNGSTFTASVIQSGSTPYTNLAFLDFNSDACTDLLWSSASQSTLYISGCNGSAASTINLGSAQVIGVMDWDGDGRADILVANGSTIGVYLSTGNGLSSLQSTSIPYSLEDYFTFQPNGDGLDALGYFSAADGPIGYYKHNGAGTPPDLLTSATDAFGNSASPTYVSLVGGSSYENYTDATYPYENYIGPMYVVNKATFSDPSSSTGGTYNQTYYYYGAWTNLQGRGWQSFYATQFVDSRDSLTYLHYYERSFPYTGMNWEDRVYNGTFNLSETVNTLASLVTLSSTEYEQRYFAYFNNSTTTNYEVGGTENGDLITTTSTNYTRDSYGNPTSITKVVTDNDPSSPYLNQTWTTTTTNTWDESTSPYCLSLLSTSQVGYTASGGGTGVTINKNFTPNTADCNYTQIVTQPNTSFQVTEAVGYDAFGNVSSDSITGVNMTARTTSTSWTTSSVTTGQFPMTVTDPTGAQTQYNYNFSYGKMSSSTDANGLTTSWQYTDGFGRKTQETRPDGTYTTYNYSNCAPTNQCLAGTNGLDVAYDVYGSNGTTITFGSSYSDPIERPLVNLQVTLGGWYTRTDIRYDSLGRVSQKSFPCQYSSFTTACTYWTTNTYDVLNRLAQSQRPISSTNSNLQTTTYAYAGRTTTVTDALNNARVAVTDVNGWLRQTRDPMGYNVTLAYDAAGDKTSVSDSLGNTLWSGTYNYGIKAFLATANDNDMGAWNFTNDALGETTGWEDAKRQSFSETYDALSRPLTRTEPDLFTQWTYGASASSHNIGRLQSVCTGTGNSPSNCTGTPGYSESETYDSDGRLSQRAITLPSTNGGTFTYTWAYNATTGLVNFLTYPTSTSGYAFKIQYGFANGYLASIWDVSDTPATAVWSANTMNPAGQITEETLGNGILTNRVFDAVTGWLGSAESGVGGGGGVKNLAFLYNEMGDVTQRQDNNLGLTENIYYDNDCRFSYSTLNSTQNLSVTYDGKGNITSRSDVASGASWTYGTSQIHAVTQAGSSAYAYAYDANGNATSRQGNTIAWSSYNYPTTVSAGTGSTAETVSFNYGPSRQRWQQSYSGNSTTEITDYVGGLFEVVTSGGVTNYRHYINAGGENVAVYSRQSNGTNTFNYMLSDHQASVASITNSSGAQVVGESFTAFGNHRNPTTWSGADTTSDLTTIAGITRQGYTFQTALGLWMGMNHMNGRVEDSITGRMLSADPHIPDTTNPQSYNRYSYANNNPVTFTDPTGFSSCPLQTCKPVDGSTAMFGPRHHFWGGTVGDPGALPLNWQGSPGSVQGISGFDVTDCDGCSTGSNISNGLSDEQETEMLATGGSATAVGGGYAILQLPGGTVAGVDSSGSVVDAVLPWAPSYNLKTGAGLYADNNLPFVNISASSLQGEAIAQQVQQQIDQATSEAQSQIYNSVVNRQNGMLVAHAGVQVLKGVPIIGKVAEAGIVAVAGSEALNVLDGSPTVNGVIDASAGLYALRLGGWGGVAISGLLAALQYYPGGPSAFFSNWASRIGQVCGADAYACSGGGGY
jgi:RHS repeat-associated protein